MQVVNGLLLIAVFLLGIFALNRQSMNEVQPASFLPPDTLIYLDQKNGTAAIQRFHDSRLGKTLTTIDYLKVLQDVDVDQVYLRQIDTTLSTLKRLQKDRLVREILGKRCALALFAQRSWSAGTGSIEEYLKNHILLISKPQVNSETMDALIAEYSSGIPLTVVRYGEYLIKRLQIDNDSISLVFIDGYILASLEERILREALDLHDEKNSSLGVDAGFQSLAKELAGSERLFFFSIEGLQTLAASGSGFASTEREQAILSEISSFKGLKSLAYGTRLNKKIAANKIVVGLNQQLMDTRAREIVDTTPSINYTLPFVAKDVLFYYWSNTLNMRLLWEMYVSEAGENSQEIKEFRNSLKHLTGYDLADILELISSNVSIVIDENARDQFVPIPDFAVLLKIKDPVKIGDAIKHSLKRLDIKTQSRHYKNIEYYSWGIYPEDSLQPVYAIHRGYLIFANSFDILKSIIDTPVNESRLIAAPGFKELDPGFQTLNNSVCYADQGKLLEHMREFISWAGTILAIQDRQEAEKSKILIDNLINPIFWGLAMYDKSATRTYLKDDRIIIESQTRITQ